MCKKKSWQEKLAAVCLVLLMMLSPFAAKAYDPDGGIYTPAKSKDIVISLDPSTMSMTEEEFIAQLRLELEALGADLDKINISLLRRELDATNTHDWYIYDHRDVAWGGTPNTTTPAAGATFTPGTWWTSTAAPALGKTLSNWTDLNYPTAPNPTDSGTAHYELFTPSEAQANVAHANVPAATYPIPQTARYNGTIQSVIDAYGIDGLRLAWQLREHIYPYATSVPGSDSKYANMVFAGYGKGNIVDYMYYPIDQESFGSIEFDMDSAFVNDHSLFGTGFLINTGLDSSGYQQGLLLYFEFNASGNGTGKNAIQKVTLYRLNSGVTPAMLQGDMATSANNLLLTRVSTINLLSGGASLGPTEFPTGTQSHWRITFSETDLSIAANNIGETETYEHAWSIPSTGFYGFGPLISYAGHGCSQGTAFQFTNVLMATQFKDIFLNLKDAQFNSGTDVERYFVNIISEEIDENNYSSDPDIYWDTVNRMKSEEIYYLTNNTNSILTDGGLKDSGEDGDHLQNGETFGTTDNDLIKDIAAYIWNAGVTRDFELNTNPSGGTKPTAVFTLLGQEGTNDAVALQAIEVQRVDPLNPVEIYADDASVPGASEGEIVEWVYTIVGPNGDILKTITIDHTPHDDVLLYEIKHDSEIGKYKVELVVKDEYGVYAEKVTKTFDVRKDEIPPVVSLGPSSLTTNTDGEYEQTPHTFAMTDEGWGVIAYQIEYLEYGTTTPLTGVLDSNGEPYDSSEVVLADRALSLSVSNNVSGLPSKYDIRVTATDWAGNKTVETYTINTRKGDANAAIAALVDYQTAAEILLLEPDIEEVQDLIDEALRLVEEYLAGETNPAVVAALIAALENYAYIAEAESALALYTEYLEFCNEYGDVTTLTLGQVLTAEDILLIEAAAQAFDDLPAAVQALLSSENTVITALKTKIGNLSTAAAVFDDLSTCTVPENIDETNIASVKAKIADAETAIQDYLDANPSYTLEDILAQPEYQTYLEAKSVVDSYDDAQDFLNEYDAYQYIALGDIPSLTSAEIDALIQDLTQAVDEDFADLNAVAQYFAEAEYTMFSGLLKKAVSYKGAGEAIDAIASAVSDPDDLYEILMAVLSDPASMQDLFDEAKDKMLDYTSYGTPSADLADYGVYTMFSSAFTLYGEYVDYNEEYIDILALSTATVKTTDIPEIENAIYIYEQITDPALAQALLPEYQHLLSLLAEAEDLLEETASLIEEIEELIDDVNQYQSLGSVNWGNAASIEEVLEQIAEKLERLLEIGGTQADIPDYDVYQNVVNEYSRFSTAIWVNDFDPDLDMSNQAGNPSPGTGTNTVVNTTGTLVAATTPQPLPAPLPASTLPQEGEGAQDIVQQQNSVASVNNNTDLLPPIPHVPQNNVVIDYDNHHYLELDENGIPIGEWYFDDVQFIWIFDEYMPGGNLPRTGEERPQPSMLTSFAALVSLAPLAEHMRRRKKYPAL